MGMRERIAQEDAEIEQVLETEKTAVEVDSEQQAVEEEKQNVELGITNVRINLSDILTNLFMAKYTIFSSMNEIDTAWGFNPFDQEKFFSIQDKEWNDFIRLSTSFDSWETMLSVASKEWASRNNFPLDHDSTVNKTQKKTHKPGAKCTFDVLVVKEKIIQKISTESMSDPEIVESIKHNDFVFTKNIVLKTSDQWFEETTQWRRLKEGSLKAYAWLLPFLPLEIAKLSEFKNILDRGPKTASKIAKQLRALIRERKENIQPHEDLLCALYTSCVLIDFAKSLSSERAPINLMARYVDIRELHNIRIDYLTMGYRYIESLTKNDKKWLIEVFGEPAEHQSFDAQWPSIRRNAMSRYCWEQLQKDNKTSSSSELAQVRIVDWLQKLVNLNLIIHKEWLEQKIAREAQFAACPVAVQPATSVKQRWHAIPAPPPKPAHSFSLDMGRIEAIRVESDAVSALLKGVFTEDAPVPSRTAVPEPTTTEDSIAGLDSESFSFMQVLATKHIWARDDLGKLADRHSLMLDGTLDSINDASYDHFGGPFFEGDDPIEINPEYAKELTA